MEEVEGERQGNGVIAKNKLYTVATFGSHHHGNRHMEGMSYPQEEWLATKYAPSGW